MWYPKFVFNEYKYKSLTNALLNKIYTGTHFEEIKNIFTINGMELNLSENDVIIKNHLRNSNTVFNILYEFHMYDLDCFLKAEQDFIKILKRPY